MFLSTKAFFENMIPGNNALLIRAETAIPAEFIRHYKKNVAPLTPKKVGSLRKSIITQQLGNTASISWRSAYAGAQNQGSHTVKEKRIVNIDGKFVTLQPGVYHYRNYTTPGTGPRFATIAFQKTEDRCFLPCSSASLATHTSWTEVTFIHFNLSFEDGFMLTLFCNACTDQLEISMHGIGIQPCQLHHFDRLQIDAEILQKIFEFLLRNTCSIDVTILWLHGAKRRISSFS